MIDCHVHFSGSIPTEFVWQTIKDKNWTYLANNHQQVIQAIKYNGQHGFDGFLHCFKIYDEIIWDEQLITQSIQAVSNKIKNDGIQFTWMDFSINKYLHTLNWHKIDIIKHFHNCFNTHLPNQIALVLSIKMESLEATRKQYLNLIDTPDVRECVAGIDLVGDEAYFDHEFYKPYLKKWYEHGKMVRIHAGEVGRIDNVRKTIENLTITNIAHGIDITNDENLMALAKRKNIQFDLALTSNLLIRKDLTTHNHPLYKMMEHGLNCTISSDDPVIFNTTLANEYALIHDTKIIETLKHNSRKFTNKYGYLL